MDPKLFPEGECRLILIGKTGNGKSSTGNTVLGFRPFQAQAGINSITRFGDLQSREYGGIELKVLDTPGLQDTEVSDEVIADRITRSLLAVSPGPHAVLLCLSCDQRFTKQELKVFETLKDLFGDLMTSYLIVVMSKRDVLEEQGIRFEDQLQSCEELKNLLAQAKGRYVLFDNRSRLSQQKKNEQVDSLLRKVAEVVIQNGRECFRHRMSDQLETTMNILRQAELKRLEQEPTARSAEAEEGPKVSKAVPESLIRLKESKTVSEHRKRFENKASEPELTPEEIASKFTLKSHRGPTPPKPPRFKLDDKAEDPDKKTATAQMAQGGFAPSGSFVYEVPDRPWMRMKDKQFLVDQALRRKLAQGKDLTEDQTKELDKASKSFGLRLREAMTKFAVSTVGMCRLM